MRKDGLKKLALYTEQSTGTAILFWDKKLKKQLKNELRFGFSELLIHQTCSTTGTSTTFGL
jgi:hypothetical protein